MNETLIWCAIIGALAYVTRQSFPSYYELTKNSQGKVDRMKTDLDALEEDVLRIDHALDALIKNLDGISGGMVKLSEAMTHAGLRLAVLEGKALNAKAEKPANEARHEAD